MTTPKPTADQPATLVESKARDATSVLSGSLTMEKERKGADLELLHLLEVTILRVDAPADAWERAAAAIKKLALSRAESRLAIS